MSAKPIPLNSPINVGDLLAMNPYGKTTEDNNFKLYSSLGAVNSLVDVSAYPDLYKVCIAQKGRTSPTSYSGRIVPVCGLENTTPVAVAGAPTTANFFKKLTTPNVTLCSASKAGFGTYALYTLDGVTWLYKFLFTDVRSTIFSVYLNNNIIIYHYYIGSSYISYSSNNCTTFTSVPISGISGTPLNMFYDAPNYCLITSTGYYLSTNLTTWTLSYTFPYAMYTAGLTSDNTFYATRYLDNVNIKSNVTTEFFPPYAYQYRYTISSFAMYRDNITKQWLEADPVDIDTSTYANPMSYTYYSNAMSLDTISTKSVVGPGILNIGLGVVDNKSGFLQLNVLYLWSINGKTWKYKGSVNSNTNSRILNLENSHVVIIEETFFNYYEWTSNTYSGAVMMAPDYNVQPLIQEGAYSTNTTTYVKGSIPYNQLIYLPYRDEFIVSKHMLYGQYYGSNGIDPSMIYKFIGNTIRWIGYIKNGINAYANLMYIREDINGDGGYFSGPIIGTPISTDVGKILGGTFNVSKLEITPYTGLMRVK